MLAPVARVTGGRLSRPSSNLWVPRVMIVNLLVSATLSAMRPTVSYRALALDASPLEVGLIAAAFGALSLVIVIPAGRWIDRFGEPRFMVAGAVTMALVGAVILANESLASLIVAMIALGCGQIVAIAAVQTLLANGGEPRLRDARFGTQTVIASLGHLIGPAAAGFIIADAMRSMGTTGASVPLEATDGVFVLCIAMAAGAAISALSLWRWPPRIHDRPHPADEGSAESTGTAVRKVLGVPGIPQAMLASLAVLSCVDVLIVYLPVFGDANGIPVQTIGLLLAVRGLASMLSRLIIMPMLQLFGRRRLLTSSMVVSGVMLILIPLAGSNVLVLTITLAVIGFGLGMGQPLTLGWVATQSPSESRGTAIGLRLSANRFGQFVIPAVAGLIAGAAGVIFAFWSLAGLLTASAALVTRTRFGQGTDPASEPDG